MLRKSLAACLLCVLLPLPGRSGEAHFVLVFAAQRTPLQPNYSHTFATFVRVTWDGKGPCPSNPTIQAHTVSWFAESMKVRVSMLLPAPGRNCDLDTTLEWCQSKHAKVSLWGPYRIYPELYQLSLQKAADLESGHIRYRTVDVGFRSERVSNCIRAAGSVATGDGSRLSPLGWGNTASRLVLRDYEPYIVDTRQVHSWLASALGLDAYPIIQRELHFPVAK